MIWNSAVSACCPQYWPFLLNWYSGLNTQADGYTSVCPLLNAKRGQISWISRDSVSASIGVIAYRP